jgi:hypothetical protein
MRPPAPAPSICLNGLNDAKMDHMPVFAIVGQQARSALGSSDQQEVDLQTLFKDVAGDFVATASVPSQVRHLINRAVRIAAARRTMACVILPNDVQQLPYEEPPVAHGSTHTGVGYAGPAQLPGADLLQAAADVLNAGEKVAILVGAGALGATDEVIAIAKRLQAGAAKALLGKAVLPDDLPWVTGQIGLLGTEPSWDLMQQCDTLLMIGSAFPYSEFLPKPGRARGVSDRHRRRDAQPALPDRREHRRRQRCHPSAIRRARLQGRRTTGRRTKPPTCRRHLIRRGAVEERPGRFRAQLERQRPWPAPEMLMGKQASQLFRSEWAALRWAEQMAVRWVQQQRTRRAGGASVQLGRRRAAGPRPAP